MRRLRKLSPHFGIGLLAGAAVLSCLTASASAASPLYYCPDRKADQQYSATQGPGCVGLGEKNEHQTDENTGGKPRRGLNLDDLQNQGTGFLNKYHRVRDCCTADRSEVR